MKSIWLFVGILVFGAAVGNAVENSKAERARLERIQESLTGDIRRVRCLDENFAIGAQPPAKAMPRQRPRDFVPC